jgi:uncharacterized protein (TIGR02145 family)
MFPLEQNLNYYNMLRGFYLLFLLSLLVSCTKSSDNTEPVNNAPITFLPVAPTNLSGSTDTSFKTTLTWVDNSTNEDGFKIERKIQNESYSLIGTTLKDVTKFVDTGLSENTTYFYRVYSYNSKGKSLTYSNEASVKTIVLPRPNIVISYTSFTNNKAVIESNIWDVSKNVVLDKGIVWSSTFNPTITDNKISYGAGYNLFRAVLNNLSKNTVYNVRAYATYSFGTFYSNNLSFTTLNETVKIGNQEWMTSNLDVSTYTDGTPIPQVTNFATLQTLTTGAWCYLSNDTLNGHKYGKLYNWYAVMGIHDEISKLFPPNRKKLAPLGYHIPSYSEFGILVDGLGGLNNAAAKLKVNYAWPTKGNNSTGFSALPGGSVSSFSNADGNRAWWWSSTDYNEGNASYMHFNDDLVVLFPFNTKSFFQSVRCIKD